jgi:cytochrome c peroxidase
MPVSRSRAITALLVLLLGVCAHAQTREIYDWELPPGFPVPRVPADNPMSVAKIELGRFLFYSKRLSGNGTTACSSCHRQELAFTDGRPRAVGSTGHTHTRGSMSLTNVAYNASLNWASHDVLSLERQAAVPMFNEAPVELGVTGHEQEILERFRVDSDYRTMFDEAFPGQDDPITMPNIVRAIAAFERVLISGNSPRDRLVYHGEPNALTPEARRGMRLFFSEKTSCSQCHGGFNFGGPVSFEGPDVIEPTFHNTGLYNLDDQGSYPAEDTGLHSVTGKEQDMGRFRAPTLRNIAVTAPYMHDGSIATLGGVVDFYAAGGRVISAGKHRGDGRANPYKSERVAGFELTISERTDLIRFLESLTDNDFLTDPRIADPEKNEGRYQRQATAER